jgi:hypothetical protein
MYAAAPRIESRLLRAIALIDDPGVPMAETNRRARVLAAKFGVPRPSYERVRRHLRETRRAEERRREKTRILIGVATYTRPVEDLYQLLD